MSLDEDIFSALRGLVDDRVYPIIFPQPPSVPVWPSIRYTFISRAVQTTACGWDADADFATVQIDIVDKTVSSVRSLRESVVDIFENFDPPATIELSFETYDMETSTYRVILDVMIHSSTT